MKKRNVLFISSLLVLAACSSVPRANNSDGKDSPETVEITYHIKFGMEPQMQAVLSRAWTIYNKEHLVFAQPHFMVTTQEYGNRPRVVETFTWVSHSAPDHAPKSVSDIWNEIQDLCEPRGGHDAVEMSQVPTTMPKR
jgi:hypothetical protein